MTTIDTHDMTTIDTHGTFEEVVAEAAPALRDLAEGARALIAEVYPGATEVPWPRQGIVGYGVGPKKMSEHFGYVGVHGAHVNLGFNYGADLPDPEGLLEGSGKKLRHVKIRRREDLERPALRALVEAAIGEREAALGRAR